MTHTANILSSPIEYLKGIGPQRADLLKKELGIFTFWDLLNHFPYRHVDKTKVNFINEITPETEFIQVTGTLVSFEVIGHKQAKRAVGQLKDKTGFLELTWFQGISWIQKTLKIGEQYLVYGRVSFFKGNPQIVHPEIEKLTLEKQSGKNFQEPVYPSTEKLKSKFLGGKQIGKLMQTLIAQISERDIPEILPATLLQQLKLIDRYSSYKQIHFPKTMQEYDDAVRRLKFEELFIALLRMQWMRSKRHRFSEGIKFDKVGELFNSFYKNDLPFELTNAQKKVIKEIRADTAKGKQMNRLLQGDVGSGKTIVAVMIMLLAIDNDYQACLMAPTEILAQQHFNTIENFLQKLPVSVALLTGSTKTAERKKILEELKEGKINILIGTHAVIEESVQFKKLGLVIIDEQHRFGVEQRAKLWEKARPDDSVGRGKISPHVLVMTATPIPRTLAMSVYGDLDYSVIDELPPGRQPVVTVHRYDTHRSKVMSFLRSEIDKGRQAYIIFPLIEESVKLDYENLMKGYEEVKAYFPEHLYRVSMVHGKQPVRQRETNMQRFIKGDTQILVSTTVIEVGVDISNATVMVIESAEKFGLSQLHQLRGRVGRGAEKSYCILLTNSKLGNDARERIRIMVSTTNGFEIAEKDLELRGPGDIEGTRQSGVLNFKLANIVQDKVMLEVARNMAAEILEKDEDLSSAENLRLKGHLNQKDGDKVWSRIS